MIFLIEARDCFNIIIITLNSVTTAFFVIFSCGIKSLKDWINNLQQDTKLSQNHLNKTIDEEYKKSDTKNLNDSSSIDSNTFSYNQNEELTGTVQNRYHFLHFNVSFLHIPNFRLLKEFFVFILCYVKYRF